MLSPQTCCVTKTPMKSGETEFRVSNDGQPRNGQPAWKACCATVSVRSYLSFLPLARSRRPGSCGRAGSGALPSRRTYPIAENAAVIVCGPLISLLSAKWRGRAAVAARRGRGDSGGVSQRVGGGGSSKGLREYYVARQSFA